MNNATTPTKEPFNAYTWANSHLVPTLLKIAKRGRINDGYENVKDFGWDFFADFACFEKYEEHEHAWDNQKWAIVINPKIIANQKRLEKALGMSLHMFLFGEERIYETSEAGEQQ